MNQHRLIMEEFIQRQHFPMRLRRNAGQMYREQYRPAEPFKREVQHKRVNIDGDIISYSGGDDGRVGIYVAANPLTPDHNYFEVEVLETGIMGVMGVGLVSATNPLDRQPGFNADSVSFHIDDGKLFKGNSRGRPFGTKCHINDKVGCGIKFEQLYENGAPQQMVPVFFTRNGKEIGTVLCAMPVDGFFPALSMMSEGEEMKLNLDAEWDHKDVILMSIDNCEEEWSRLHDIRINGMIMEYTGRGKSIIDVGLAQAKNALDTTNHYFEIEITDPGESCYIAIGLAKKDYPRDRHPGWNKGSIAYHADDGKIFVGSGVGDPFGPKCQKGDIMGCGILFPRDYSCDADSDGTHDLSPGHLSDCESDDHLRLDDQNSSESEDEEWWERPNAENGTKVQVFFTRNGKTIGRVEIRIPKGGFYPTIGMMSSDEKVRVDLRPLTG